MLGVGVVSRRMAMSTSRVVMSKTRWMKSGLNKLANNHPEMVMVGAWQTSLQRSLASSSAEATPPKRPLTAYMLWSLEYRAVNPGVKLKATDLGEKWSRMTVEEKKSYVEQAHADNEKYKEAKKEYEEAHGTLPKRGAKKAKPLKKPKKLSAFALFFRDFALQEKPDIAGLPEADKKPAAKALWKEKKPKEKKEFKEKADKEYDDLLQAYQAQQADLAK